MTLHIAYFQPTIIAIDQVPPVEFSQIFNLTNQLHDHPELNDSENPFLSIRGGQQIQVYPNQLNIDVTWLVKYLETMCRGYMEIVTQQSGKEDLKLCKPVVTSIWTIKQGPGQYQELHSHPGGNLSGNMYISVPELAEGSQPTDAQVAFRMPQTRDVSKFVMNDTWTYKPQAGTIILFPSHIPHTVYPWNGTGTRMVLAFDARLEPDVEQAR
jgi:uncharacterized protein (TIGR02466 family)